MANQRNRIAMLSDVRQRVVAELDVRDELDELQRADERFAYDDTERFKAALNSPTYEEYLARESDRTKTVLSTRFAMMCTLLADQAIPSPNAIVP